MKKFLLTVVAIVSIASVSASAGVIYSESFSGTGGLNGTAPDVGSGTWVASSPLTKDGIIVGGGGDDNAFLPFTPVAGNLYTLSATLTQPIGSWVGIGFTGNATYLGSGGADDFWRNDAAPWVLYRGTGGVDTWTGVGVLGKETEDTYTGTIDLAIVLDTQAETWTAEWFVNGTSVRGPVNVVTEDINYVAFGRENGTSVTIDDFTLTANILPLNPNPADGDTVGAANPLTLSWDHPYPTEPNVVLFDVWFGTDPCTPGETTWKKYPAGEDATSLDVDTSAGGTYYWRIDVTVGTDPVIEGDLLSFDTLSDPPPTVEIPQVSWQTFSDAPVPLDAMITDSGSSALTVNWTHEFVEGIGDPNLCVVDYVPTDEDPVVTVTNNNPGRVVVIMTVSVEDGANPGVIDQATASINVFPTACRMAYNFEGKEPAQGDINHDCVTDLLDLAELAKDWLDDYSSTGAMPG